jgi:hypothetical protein
MASDRYRLVESVLRSERVQTRLLRSQSTVNDERNFTFRSRGMKNQNRTLRSVLAFCVRFHVLELNGGNFNLKPGQLYF